MPEKWNVCLWSESVEILLLVYFLINERYVYGVIVCLAASNFLINGLIFVKRGKLHIDTTSCQPTPFYTSPCIIPTWL